MLLFLLDLVLQIHIRFDSLAPLVAYIFKPLDHADLVLDLVCLILLQKFTFVLLLLMEPYSDAAVDRLVLHDEAFHLLERLEREAWRLSLPMLVHVHNKLYWRTSTGDVASPFDFVQVNQPTHIDFLLDSLLILLHDVSLEFIAHLQMIFKQREPVAAPNEIALALSLCAIYVLRLFVESKRIIADACNILVEKRKLARTVELVANLMIALLKKDNLFNVLQLIKDNSVCGLDPRLQRL